jgi:hypothetical protein
VNKKRVSPDEPFTVTATLTNGGDDARSYDVDLELFGSVVESRSVSVPAGERRAVKFTVSIAAPGTYEPAVNGESATVTVVGGTGGDDAKYSDPDDDLGSVPGFHAIGAVAALVAFLVLAVRRRGSTR